MTVEFFLLTFQVKCVRFVVMMQPDMVAVFMHACIYQTVVHSGSFFSSFAYVEFADKESALTAMALDDSLFRGRQMKVKESGCMLRDGLFSSCCVVSVTVGCHRLSNFRQHLIFSGFVDLLPKRTVSVVVVGVVNLLL